MAERANTLPVFRPENSRGAIYEWSSDVQPKTEALALLKLLLRGGETIQSLRALIGFAPDRRPVLREFDLLTLRLPKHPEHQKKLRFRQKCNGRALSAELRNEIVVLLKAGSTQKKILEKYPVGPGVVLKIAKEIGASYLKPRGRGRRFSPGTWQKILAAVKSGRTSRDIEREFKCDYVSVLKARKELGDFENRRLRLKITPEQIARAEGLLRSGEKWRDVARTIGLSQTTIIARVKYRKHQDPSFPFVKLSRAKYDLLAAELRTGKSIHAILKETGTSSRTLLRVRRAEGVRI